MDGTGTKGNIIEEFERLLEKKKMSDDNIPRADLEGKYRKSYNRLKKDICQMLGELLPHFLLSGMKFERHDGEAGEVCQKAQDIMDEARRAGEFLRIRDVAYNTCSLDQVLCEAVPLHNKIMYEAYSGYWLRRCSPVTVPGYSHYNSIVEMWYNEGSGQWMRKLPNGDVQYATLFPPTRELFDMAYTQNKKQPA